MRVRLLGLVDVEDSGRVVDLSGARRRAVLATLALRPGELVSGERLVDAIWGDDPPATARNALHVHIAHLRGLLGAEAIMTRGPGYVLTLAAPASDVAVVEGLLAEATVAPGPESRVPLFERALAHWRSAPLGGVGDSGYLARHAYSLTELRVTTAESYLADLVRCGRHTEAVGPAEALALEHPERERPVEILMTALHRSGRRAEALAAYRRHRDHARVELGIDPSPRLRALQERVLRDEAGPDRPGAPPPVAGVTTPRGPARPAPTSGRSRSPIVGRESDVRRAEELMREGRLLTILGMGGVGKTRLASELADRHTGAVAVVDLTDVEPESGPAPMDAVATRVVAALRLQAQEGTAAVDRIVAALAAQPHLLVIDNCEPLLDTVADLVGELLDRVPDLRLVATSRAALRLDGEACLALHPLGVRAEGPGAPAAAVELILRSARAADAAYAPTVDDVATLHHIAERVDGLPLALQIVGARLRSLTVQEVSAGLDERLLHWQDDRRGVAVRHRSIAGLIDWSLELLDEDERRAMHSLASTQGGAWLAEAGALCGADRLAGEALLLALVDRSLVGRREVDGRTRLQLHPLVRSHLLERQRLEGTREAYAAAHVTWVRALVAADAAAWHGPEEEQRLRWRVTDAGNVDLALRTSHAINDTEALGELVARFWWWWHRTGAATEGVGWAAVALEQAVPALRGQLEAAAGYLNWQIDDYVSARQHAMAGLEAGDQPAVRGLALGVLSRVAGDEGDFAGAVTYARESVTAYELAGDRWGAAWSRRCLGAALLYAGDALAAESEVTAALDGFREVGDRWGEAGSLTLSARIATTRGQREDAVELAGLAAQAHRSVNDASGERSALQHLAESQWRAGDLIGAGDSATEALSLSQRHGYPVGALQAALLLRDVAVAGGDEAAAARMGAAADALTASLGERAELSLALAANRSAVTEDG